MAKTMDMIEKKKKKKNSIRINLKWNEVSCVRYFAYFEGQVKKRETIYMRENSYVTYDSSNP